MIRLNNINFDGVMFTNNKHNMLQLGGGHPVLGGEVPILG